MIDRLPEWGRYKSELAMDEEWAKVICDMEDAEKEHPPAEVFGMELRSPFRYDPISARLDSIMERIGAVETAIIWTTNPKEQRPPVKEIDRPVTAVDLERERRGRSLLEEVDRMLTGEGLPMIFE